MGYFLEKWPREVKDWMRECSLASWAKALERYWEPLSEWMMVPLGKDLADKASARVSQQSLEDIE